MWNDARAIERCVDKSTTTFFLQRAGIPTPWTWTAPSRRGLRGREAKLAEGTRSCRSRCSARKAKGLRLIASPDDLAPARRGERRLLSARVYSVGRRTPVATGGFSSAPAGRRRHDPAWVELDHQHQQGARAECRDPLARACRSRLRAVDLRWRRLCRASTSSRPRRRAFRARGEQHAGLARATAGHARAHRRFHRSPPSSTPASVRPKRACRARPRAREEARLARERAAQAFQ